MLSPYQRWLYVWHLSTGHPFRARAVLYDDPAIYAFEDALLLVAWAEGARDAVERRGDVGYTLADAKSR